jgi:D-alanyl-D-alanine carboxypeptidase
MKLCTAASLPLVVSLCLLFSFIAVPPLSPKAVQPQDGVTLPEKLQTAVEKTRDRYNLLGVSAAATVNNVTAVSVSGYSDAHTLAPVEPEMVFGIFSLTKTFIATVVLQLTEEGILDLDDTIDMWLDIPGRYARIINKDITVRQLLNHTSGIADFQTNPLLYLSVLLFPHKAWLPEDVFSFLRKPFSPPGEKWHYSSTNYILLGMIIEQATDTSVSTEIRSRILEPLNLTRTFFRGEESIVGPVASPHFLLGNQPINIDHFYTDEVFNLVWSSGALYSTAEDLTCYASDLFSGRLLNQHSMDEMLDFIHDVQLYPTIRPFSSGLGVMAIEHEKFGPVWFNSGYSLGYQTWWVYLPAIQVACTVLINQDPERIDDTMWHPIEYLIDLLVFS